MRRKRIESILANKSCVTNDCAYLVWDFGHCSRKNKNILPIQAEAVLLINTHTALHLKRDSIRFFNIGKQLMNGGKKSAHKQNTGSKNKWSKFTNMCVFVVVVVLICMESLRWTGAYWKRKTAKNTQQIKHSMHYSMKRFWTQMSGDFDWNAFRVCLRFFRQFQNRSLFHFCEVLVFLHLFRVCRIVHRRSMYTSRHCTFSKT